MALNRLAALRQGFAALIVLALMFAGFGRSLAFVDAMAAGPGAVPICHGSAETGSDPAAPPADHHDCCDACVLAAPALPPDAPQLAALERADHVVAPPQPRLWTAVLSRHRDPKQARGPPLA